MREELMCIPVSAVLAKQIAAGGAAVGVTVPSQDGRMCVAMHSAACLGRQTGFGVTRFGTSDLRIAAAAVGPSHA
jgi:hypothetical protein